MGRCLGSYGARAPPRCPPAAFRRLSITAFHRLSTACRCASERCLEELKRPGKHQCHICWKDFCEYCVHKRRLSESDGGKSRVVVCDICFYSIARKVQESEEDQPSGIAIGLMALSGTSPAVAGGMQAAAAAAQPASEETSAAAEEQVKRCICLASPLPSWTKTPPLRCGASTAFVG